MFVYTNAFVHWTIPKLSKLYYVKIRKQENKAKFILKCSEKFNHRIMLKRKVSQVDSDLEKQTTWFGLKFVKT